MSQGGHSKYTGRGGPTYFFGLEIYTLGIFWGSKDLAHIFLGLKKNTRIFFWVLSPSELLFRVFVAISGSEKYSFELFFQQRVFRKNC